MKGKSTDIIGGWLTQVCGGDSPVGRYLLHGQNGVLYSCDGSRLHAAEGLGDSSCQLRDPATTGRVVDAAIKDSDVANLAESYENLMVESKSGHMIVAIPGEAILAACQGLQKAARQAKVHLGDNLPTTIRFSPVNGEITLSLRIGTVQAALWVRECIFADPEGEDLSFGVDVRYLVEALAPMVRLSSEAPVQIRARYTVDDPIVVRMAWIHPGTGEPGGLTALIAPMQTVGDGADTTYVQSSLLSLVDAGPQKTLFDTSSDGKWDPSVEP